MIVAGIAIGAVALVLALTSIGGSSGSGKSTSGSASTGAKTAAQRTAAHPKAHHRAAAHTTVPANAPQVSVAVLNATETNGLAHRVSSELQHAGYAQAAPLNGHPPGTGQTTVVQYAAGHRGDAEAVAHALGVSQTQPVEASVTPLAGAASVIVIVGADKAAAGT
jgi:hypothetical protein